MLLKRFVQYFGRARPAALSDIERTEIRFRVDDREILLIRSIEYDIAANAWTVNLTKTDA